MAILAQKQEQEAPNNQDQLGKLYSFKKEKARYRKSYIDWDKIKRANQTNFCREKARNLSKDAKAILAPVIQKLEKGESVFLNHKYISTITQCERGQNRNIIKQLETVLDITYHNSITVDGKKHRYSYEFAYYKQEIVPQEENSIAQFIERDESLNPSYQVSSDTSIENNNTESIRSNVHAHESNFLQNSESIKLEEILATKTAIISQAPVKPAKLKTRPVNERKKRTNAERRARVYHFNQYEELKDLGYHYPLTTEDCRLLQNKAGRDFDLNAMNEILLDMSNRKDNRFCSKAQFLAYFGKCLRFEMRDAVKISNSTFRIKANNNPINQIKDFEVVGGIVRIYLRADCQLNRYETNLVLSQFKSIYSALEVDIESVEYVVENVYNFKSTNRHNSLQTKENIVIPTLQQGIWGDICCQLIKTYGIHIYNNWFSNLTHVIDEQNKTIELKTPNLFIQQWIETHYGEGIINIIKKLGLELKEFSNSSNLKRGY